MLTLLHWATDCYGSFVPALWLVLRSKFDLTEFQTGLLMSVVLIPANVMQPVWGALSDRFDAKWLVVAGPLLAIVCLSMVGLAPSLGITVMLLALGMLGVGLFHPEAATLATRFGAAGSPRTMALFLGGGFLGQAIGPWFISQVISEPRPTWLLRIVGRPSQGFTDAWMTIFPGLVIVVVGALMVARLGHLTPPATRTRQPSLGVLLAGRQRPVWTLFIFNVVRIYGLLMLFFTLPEYLYEQGKGQIAVGNWMMAYLLGQFVGIVAGGLTAPIHRERVLLVVSMSIALLPAWVLPFAHGPVAALALAATGLCVAWTHPTAVQLGQAIVPRGERWVSGMMIGMSWGIGALTAPPLIGWLIQSTGSAHVALIIGAALLTAAPIIALCLPRQSHLNQLKNTHANLRDAATPLPS